MSLEMTSRLSCCRSVNMRISNVTRNSCYVSLDRNVLS